MNEREHFDRFTQRARKVLSLAQEEAQRFNHNYIGTEHLLLGLVREGHGVAAKVLSSFGVELNTLRSAVELLVGRGDQIVLGEPGLTPDARKVIELAVDEAQRLNHPYTGTEHVLLGLVRESEGIAVKIVMSLGVDLEKVRTQTVQVLSYAQRLRATLPAASEDASRSTAEAAFAARFGRIPHVVVTPQNLEEAADALKEALKKLEAVLNEKEAAIQQQEYELAAELRDREVNLRDHIARLEANWHKEQQSKKPFAGEGEKDNLLPS